MMMPNRHGSVFALILIVAGALLFLDNLGVLPIRNIEAYWPLALVAWGISLLDRGRGANGIIWAATLVVFGGLLTLGNLHILHVTGDIIWPLVLIAFGAMMLVGRWQGPLPPLPRFPPNSFGIGSSGRGSSYFGDKLIETVVFGGAQRRVESQNFEGGKVDAVFGGMELDLSGAAITAPGRRVMLEANAVFGGIDITVPRTWRVEKGRGSAAVFGGFDDKTFPPRPEPGFDPPTLVIKGAAVFGGISVKNA